MAVEEVPGGTTPSATEQPAHRLTRDERRHQLLDTAGAMAVEEGVESLTMEGVAARAGVSKALPYKFFGNREDLLLALYDREIDQMGERLDATTEGIEDFEERLRVTVTVWLEHMAERGMLLGILMTVPLLSGPIQQRQARTGRNLAVEWGERATVAFGIEPTAAVDAAAMILAGSQGMLQRWIQAPQRRQELADTFVHLALAAFRSLGTENSPAAP
jgi:AcrR family transcriptional regulator